MGKKRVPPRVLAEVTRLAVERKRQLVQELEALGLVAVEKPKPAYEVHHDEATGRDYQLSTATPKHMDFPIVKSGRVARHRLSKRDRAIRKRQDAGRGRRRRRL